MWQSDALMWVLTELSSDEFTWGKLRSWQAQINLPVGDLVVCVCMHVCVLLSYLILFQEWLLSYALVALFSNQLTDAYQLLDTQKKTVTWALSHKPCPQVSSHRQKRISGQVKRFFSSKNLVEIKIGQKFKRERATAKQARILAKRREKKHWSKRRVTMARQQLHARIWLRSNITQSCDCLFKASPWENSCLQWVFSQLGSKIITAFFSKASSTSSQPVCC